MASNLPIRDVPVIPTPGAGLTMLEVFCLIALSATISFAGDIAHDAATNLAATAISWATTAAGAALCAVIAISTYRWIRNADTPREQIVTAAVGTAATVGLAALAWTSTHS